MGKNERTLNSAVCMAVAKISPRNAGESTSCVLSCFTHVTNHKNRHILKIILGSIVQFSHSVISNSLRPHEPQHARLPCPSPTPRVYPNSCPLSGWWHSTISSSVVPFSSHLQSFPASGSFQWVGSCIRWPKYWSFSFSISPSIEHPGLTSFCMDWLDLLAVQGTLKSLLQHHSSKASIFSAQLSSQSNSHIHTWLLEKP